MIKNLELKPMAERFNITSRPETERTFTTAEAAEALNCSKATIAQLVRRFALPFVRSKTGKGAARLFEYATVKKMAEILKSPRVKKTTPDTDADAAAHPLVTNPDFLKLSYFPDVIPACFAEDGDE